MNTVARSVTASTARARAYCATLPPSEIRWQGQYHLHTAGEIAESTESLPPELTRVEVKVDLDALSPLARELAESAPDATNRRRANDYTMTFSRSTADVQGYGDDQRRVYGDGGNYKTAFHFPYILDNETGEQYYERCARLVELYRVLIDGMGMSARAVRSIASKVERYQREWTIDEVVESLRKPGRPVGSGDNRVITKRLKLTPEEDADLQRRVEESGDTWSQYVRRQLFK